MSEGISHIAMGQALLALCCVLYIVWWGACYRPGSEFAPASGWHGIMLFIMMIAGLGGVYLSADGVHSLPAGPIGKCEIVAAALGSYIVLLLFTKLSLHRPVTAELLLIVAWAGMESAVILALYSSGAISHTLLIALAVLLLAGGIVSLILYVMYYHLEPMTGYYAGMVPLAIDGLSSAVIGIVARNFIV